MSVETGTITLENSLFGEKTFESTMAEAGGGSGGSPGYDVTTETEIIVSETTATWQNQEVFFLAEFSDNDGFAEGETVNFTIDGQAYSYVAVKQEEYGQVSYTAGKYDPSNNVFGPAVGYANGSLVFMNPTAPTDTTVYAEKIVEEVTVTNAFKSAVDVASGGLTNSLFAINVTFDPKTYDPILDKTYAEIYTALEDGKTPIILGNGTFALLMGRGDQWLSFVQAGFTPLSGKLQVEVTTIKISSNDTITTDYEQYTLANTSD